jgi:Holliday junction resolvasome RuvABC DNA-binding subunit
MLQATRDQINAERKALEERKKIQEEFNKVKWQYTDADGNKVDVDWAKAAEDGIQDGDVATARNLMNSDGATQSALEALGYDDATLLKIIEAAEAGDENARAQIAEMFNRLQAFRDEDLELVDTDLNEMMASTATSIQELNAMMDEG